jgi:hypothetical protein
MYSNAHFDLGPLWDRSPKTSGFRLAIPDPHELSNWLRETSAYFGDIPHEELIRLNQAAIDRFKLHLSQRLLAGERVWKQPIGDKLLACAAAEMHTTYTPESGEWGDIVIYLPLSPEALAEGVQWTIPHQADAIAKILRDHGLNATADQDEDQRCGLMVTNPKGGGPVEVSLGFKTYEAALRDEIDCWGEEYVDEAKGSDNIFAFNCNLALPLPEYLEDLRHFQITFSYLVDSLYQVLGWQPSDVVLELSVLTELA